MQTKRDSSKIAIFVLAAVFVATAFFAAFAGVPVTGTAYAENAEYDWGGVSASDLWYFGANELNLASLKSVTASWLPTLASAGTEPVIIAVIDTGLNVNHPLFQIARDVLVTNSAGNPVGYNSYMASQGSSDPAMLGNFSDIDAKYHGTSVAGIMAMFIKELGLENYIKIYPINASYNKNNENRFPVDAVTRGITYAADTVKADVINLSLGILESKDTDSEWKYGTFLINAIDNATQNAVVVAAAGNDNKNSASDAYYPAAHSGVLSVMSSGKNGSKYTSSNYGTAYDLFAPGESIYAPTCATGYGEISGTSMAAAFVSVGAAVTRLRAEAESALAGKEAPTANAVARYMKTAGNNDTFVTVGGTDYKKLSVFNLLTDDMSSINKEYSDVTGIRIVTKDGTGALVETSKETGVVIKKNLSLYTFTANLLPLGDTDPALDAGIEWIVTEYKKVGEDDGTVSDVAISTSVAGHGKTFEYRFSKAGFFGIKAKVTLSGDTPAVFETEIRFSAAYSPYIPSEAFIVPEWYLQSENYLSGKGGDIPFSATVYGKESIKLGITTISDVEPMTITWYVNGLSAQICTVGENGLYNAEPVFVFDPSKFGGFGRYEITAYYGTSKIGTFVVEYKSLAQHPDFVPVWCALAIWIVQFAVIGGCLIAKKKEARRRKDKERGNGADADGTGAEEAVEKKSPIRKY